MKHLLIAILPAVLLAGCIGKRPSNPSATQPATALDPNMAKPAYWLSQPATSEVTGRDFIALWDTCEQVARSYRFKIDRRDFRAGQLVTHPLVSKQFFEPWRKDAGTGFDVRESSLGGIRRTIYFQFTQNLDNTYTIAPKVVVERWSKVDPKYRQDYDLPPTYWYALRRDTVLEAKLADSIRQQLERPIAATQPAEGSGVYESIR